MVYLLTMVDLSIFDDSHDEEFMAFFRGLRGHLGW